MTGLNLDDARCRALFASRLQPSDAPTAQTVATAIFSRIRAVPHRVTDTAAVGKYRAGTGRSGGGRVHDQGALRG
jgi:hypothetical protein